MLAITRKIGEAVVLVTPSGERIRVIVFKIPAGNRAVLVFEAPACVAIHRQEVYDAITRGAGHPTRTLSPHPPAPGAPKTPRPDAGGSSSATGAG